MGCKTVPMSLRRPLRVDKVVIVSVLALPLKCTYETVSGSLEGMIDASWEKESREAPQDSSGNDDDDGGGGDDDPAGDDPSAGSGKTRDKTKEIHERLRIDDKVGDIDDTASA